MKGKGYVPAASSVLIGGLARPPPSRGKLLNTAGSVLCFASSMCARYGNDGEVLAPPLGPTLIPKGHHTTPLQILNATRRASERDEGSAGLAGNR